MDGVVNVISQLGFPAAVALFALYIVYRHEDFLQNALTTMISENTRALEELREAIHQINKGGDIGDRQKD